jgi:hypothetical protein
MIDREPIGRIISVSVIGVPLPDPMTGEIRLGDIDHAPLEEAALDRSVLNLDGEAHPAAGFDAWYADWRQSLIAGEGGLFTITIADIINVYRKGLGR